MSNQFYLCSHVKIHITFLLIQTAYKMLELYQKLRELGHPDYLSKEGITFIPCSKCKDDLEKLVSDTEILIKEWTDEVSELRSRYNWLLFFSIPKILNVYKMVCSKNVDAIFHEVSFLTPNNAIKRDTVREELKVC